MVAPVTDSAVTLTACAKAVPFVFQRPFTESNRIPSHQPSVSEYESNVPYLAEMVVGISPRMIVDWLHPCYAHGNGSISHSVPSTTHLKEPYTYTHLST